MDERLAQVVPFAISFALGLLVGIERQHSQPDDEAGFPGGVRTFPLVALLGCSAAWAGAQIGIAAFVAIAAGFGGLVIASHVLEGLKGEHGVATALASLLTFIFGVMAYHGYALVAGALAVTTTSLLSLRRPLHELAKRLDEVDIMAALKLGALTLVVLPFLPDRSFGDPPWDVLNPFRIWLLVVFMAAIGFLGYVGAKVLGPGRGIVAAGALGGLVSSTAVTLSFSERSKEAPELGRAFALGIAIAWGTMLLRVLAEILAVNASLMGLAIIPLAGAGLGGLIGASVVYVSLRGSGEPPVVNYTNPFALSSAFKFAAIFAVTLVVARFAQLRFQDAGIYAAAALSGTVEVDAVTLSVAKLSAIGELSRETATRAILVTVLSNTILKTVMAAAIGTGKLRVAILPVVLATILGGVAALYLSS